MSKFLSPLPLHASNGALSFAQAERTAWSPAAIGLEPAMARVFAVIRDCARIAWWDGSAIGLHLSGVLGLFEATDVALGRTACDERDGL